MTSRVLSINAYRHEGEKTIALTIKAEIVFGTDEVVDPVEIAKVLAITNLNLPGDRVTPETVYLEERNEADPFSVKQTDVKLK
jgi:hypothetical protein